MDEEGYFFRAMLETRVAEKNSQAREGKKS